MPEKIKKTAIDDYYSVFRSADSVVMELIIGGYGQEALSKVRLNSKVLLAGQSGSFNLELGKGADLIGQILKVKTLVTDANANPNDNSSRLIFSLKGGQDDYARTLESTVANDGDTEDYSIKIQFYEAR
jgi:hypothetical protein